MIPRYAREQMVSIWSPETKFRIWFEIEAHATDKLAELGVVPKDAAAKIWEKSHDAKFDVERIDGDFFGVMGLPIRLVLDLLAEAGFPYEFPKR